MSQFVIDASVTVQLLVDEPDTPQVKALFATIEDGNKLYIPEFAILECANVLWKHVRFHGLERSIAEAQLAVLVALEMIIVPATGLMPRALGIGLNHNLAIYDSVYIALAEKLSFPLITVDGKQSRAAHAEDVILKDIADFAPD